MKWLMEKIFLIIISLGFIYLFWKALIFIFHYPTYILPEPSLVYNKVYFLFVQGKIYPHLFTSLVEILSGFTIGFILSVFIGYLLAKKEWLKITITPYIVAFQTIPIVALAPLFILWFGTGVTSKIIICALIVFFPVLMNTIAAINNISRQQRELLWTYNANVFQVSTKLEIPASLPYLFSSLKIGVVLSIVGATVGEFIGADHGLGFLINTSLGLFDTPQLFAVIFILALLGLSLYFIISLIEFLTLHKRILISKIY